MENFPMQTTMNTGGRYSILYCWLLCNFTCEKSNSTCFKLHYYIFKIKPRELFGVLALCTETFWILIPNNTQNVSFWLVHKHIKYVLCL